MAKPRMCKIRNGMTGDEPQAHDFSRGSVRRQKKSSGVIGSFIAKMSARRRKK